MKIYSVVYETCENEKERKADKIRITSDSCNSLEEAKKYIALKKKDIYYLNATIFEEEINEYKEVISDPNDECIYTTIYINGKLQEEWSK